MPEISVNGTVINYAGSGEIDPSRPTVLLIHGAGQRLATWRFQTGPLDDAGWNYVIPDLPGRGGSGGKGLRSVEEYKDFVKDFADALGLGKLILAGHSMGGGVALNFALDYPEKVKALVLVGTGARLRVAGETLKVVKNNYPLFCDVSPSRSFAETSPEELKEEFKNGLIATPGEVCYHDLSACNEFDFMERVHEIKAPSCIVAGTLDILAPVKYSEYLHEKIEGSELYVIEGAGHFVMQEKAERFNAVLADFLSRNK
ncbi:MAG TPA: alpha/beta hydrolase [Thermodesulfobacteriota bacterium]|nr:alpha/beta hydrolase [Thermodesulfobacteriota bacterium]